MHHSMNWVVVQWVICLLSANKIMSISRSTAAFYWLQKQQTKNHVTLLWWNNTFFASSLVIVISMWEHCSEFSAQHPSSCCYRSLLWAGKIFYMMKNNTKTRWRDQFFLNFILLLSFLMYTWAGENKTINSRDWRKDVIQEKLIRNTT